MTLPRRCRPQSHSKFRVPVVRLRKALYGLRRADLDWGLKVRKDMTERLGWRWVRNCGETSVFYQRSVVCVIFTDDFKFAGKRCECYAAYYELHPHFGFSESSATNPESGEFIRLEKMKIPVDRGFSSVKLHQTKYVQMPIAKYEKRIGHSLRSMKTPMKEKREERDKKRAEEIGEYAEEAADWIGTLLLIARGTRGDLLYVVYLLSTRLAIWSAEEDDILWRAMQYLKAHPFVGIAFCVCHQDFMKGELYLDLWTDADHTGDSADAKS